LLLYIYLDYVTKEFEFELDIDINPMKVNI